MAKRITPFLMFEGKAEEAMGFYTSIFPGSEVVEMTRYGPGEMGTEGSVKVARFRLVGREFAAIDSPVQHGFTFTPAFSLFVDFETGEELDAAYARLAEGGRVLMPLGDYGFSARFAWLDDRFGVSWQLNLPHP